MPIDCCTALMCANAKSVLQATCNMLAEKVNLLSLLHQLEAVSSGSTIGPLAEGLLEELQEAGASPVGEAIKKLRAATKAGMKEKAMARRKAMLASLNMPSTVSLGVPDAWTSIKLSVPAGSSVTACLVQKHLCLILCCQCTACLPVMGKFEQKLAGSIVFVS